jgi:tellurite resistance protein
MTFTNISQQCNSDWIGKQVKQRLYQFLTSKSNFQDKDAQKVAVRWSSST